MRRAVLIGVLVGRSITRLAKYTNMLAILPQGNEDDNGFEQRRSSRHYPKCRANYKNHTS